MTKFRYSGKDKAFARRFAGGGFLPGGSFRGFTPVGSNTPAVTRTPAARENFRDVNRGQRTAAGGGGVGLLKQTSGGGGVGGAAPGGIPQGNSTNFW